MSGFCVFLLRDPSTCEEKVSDAAVNEREREREREDRTKKRN